jgi:hypothetical protein
MSNSPERESRTTLQGDSCGIASRPAAAATSTEPPASVYPCPVCSRRGDAACTTCLGLGEVWLIDELRQYPGALQRVLADLVAAAMTGQVLPGARLVECGGHPRVVYGTTRGVRLADMTALESDRARGLVQQSVPVSLFNPGRRRWRFAHRRRTRSLAVSVLPAAAEVIG